MGVMAGSARGVEIVLLDRSFVAQTRPRRPGRAYQQALDRSCRRRAHRCLRKGSRHAWRALTPAELFRRCAPRASPRIRAFFVYLHVAVARDARCARKLPRRSSFRLRLRHDPARDDRIRRHRPGRGKAGSPDAGRMAGVGTESGDPGCARVSVPGRVIPRRAGRRWSSARILEDALATRSAPGMRLPSHLRLALAIAWTGSLER